MIADVGGIVNVSGSRMATPFAPPRPGSTPMMVPSPMPRTATKRLKGVIATRKPRRRSSIPILSEPEPRFERALRHGHEEPALEDDERHHGDCDGEAHHLP